MKAPLGLRVEDTPNPKGNRRFLLDMLPKESVGAEIGVAIGNFSSAILQVVNPAVLYLVDPYEYDPSAEAKNRFYGGKSGGQDGMDAVHDFVQERFKDCPEVWIRRERSDRFLEWIPDDSLDWIYIDGNHDYEPCLNDILGSIPKVRVGGLVTGDDYEWGPEHRLPVKRAVKWVRENEPRLEFIEVRAGQFIFRRLA